MKVEQVYSILNTIVAETLGKSDIVAEDLHNVVDVGKEITATFEMGDNNFDNYVKKLINHIGKVVFVNRPYTSRAPSVMMDGWEYGSILEKIDAELPESEATEDWRLVNGGEYKQDIFKGPKGVKAKFWNKRVTHTVSISITEKQVKESFSSATQLNAFFSMIETMIRNRLTLDRDNLIKRTVSNFVGLTLLSEVPDGTTISGRTGIRARNLLYEYNTLNPDNTLTANNCLSSLDFLKFASKQMALASDYLSEYSTLFNVGQRERFTDKSNQKIIMLSEFAKSADVYLQSDTFHNEFTKFPISETVSYWQGSGTSFSFDKNSCIHINVDDGGGGNGQEIVLNGLLCVMFDRNALGVSCPDSKVTSHYNGNGDFHNFWYKEFAGYFNDANENGIIFYVA